MSHAELRVLKLRDAPLSTAGLLPSLDDLLAAAAEGRALGDDEAGFLAVTGDDRLGDLCAAAARMRDRGKGRTVTFSPKVFIPLTRLCRDFCGYCTFRQNPRSAQGKLYLTPEEVLEVARAGERLGCTEALFTMGERPEQRYPEAGDWLRKRGYATTLHYLADVCRLVVEETSLLPHANPGTMSRREMAALQVHNPSMGLMLESTGNSLFARGGPHEFAPSKRPRVRLRTIEIAGQLRVPFTTGILIGIGETRHDRIESLLAIRRLHRAHGHIQEVIVQNFRAKPDTPMGDAPDAVTEDLLWSVAMARLVLGPDMNVQVPPNLSAGDYQIFLDAGINDWGGVSPLTMDYVNPEAPWPGMAELRDRTRSMGFELRPRLPVYPEYVLAPDGFIPAGLLPKVAALADSQGYVRGGIQRYAGIE
jgi:FO synthase